MSESIGKTKPKTIGEYLASGRQIKKLETLPPKEKELSVRSTTVNPPKLYSLEEGEYYFGERRKTTESTIAIPKKPDLSKIDLSSSIYDDLKKKLGL